MNDKEQFELSLLIEKHVAGEANTEEVSALEKWLVSDKQARVLYLDLTRQHGFLAQTLGAGVLAPVFNEEEVEHAKPNNMIHWLPWLVAPVAACVAVGTTLMLTKPVSDQSSISSNLDSGSVEVELVEKLGSILRSSSAKWGSCSQATVIGSPLSVGQLELLEGTATLELESGVTVNLEGPVRFEIATAMQTFVHYGTAVADVPERALGFRMDAPDMEVTDYGTVFAVSVNDQGKGQVNVLDGEVEVYRKGDHSRMRVYADSSSSEELLFDSVTYQNSKNTAYTALRSSQGRGGHTSVIPGDSKSHLLSDLLMVKNPINGIGYARKSYIRFDLASFSGTKANSVSLMLNQVPSNYGFQAYVPDCKFKVYALKQEEPWTIAGLSWRNAPANDLTSSSKLDAQKVVEVGGFVIEQGRQQGKIEVESKKLLELLKSEREFLTLMIVRETKESKSSGLVHTFAGDSHPSYQGPRLLFKD